MPDNQEAKLLPCPYCGRTILSVEPLHSAWGTSEEKEHVICDTCEASAPVDVWNRRSNGEELKAVGGAA